MYILPDVQMHKSKDTHLKLNRYKEDSKHFDNQLKLKTNDQINSLFNALNIYIMFLINQC